MRANERKNRGEVGGPRDFATIATSKEFKDLLAIKKLFIVPAFVIFLAYYFALAILVGYAPRLAAIRVFGTINVAYVFALSQFVMGWTIAALYLLAASKFDRLAGDILAELNKRQGEK